MFIELSICLKESVLLSAPSVHVTHVDLLDLPSAFLLITGLALPDDGYGGPFLWEATPWIGMAARELWVPGLASSLPCGGQ